MVTLIDLLLVLYSHSLSSLGLLITVDLFWSTFSEVAVRFSTNYTKNMLNVCRLGRPTFCPTYGDWRVPCSSSDHWWSEPACGSSESKMTNSFQRPRGFSAHDWVVMNGHLVNPARDSSSRFLLLRSIDLHNVNDKFHTLCWTLKNNLKIGHIFIRPKISFKVHKIRPNEWTDENMVWLPTMSAPRLAEDPISETQAGRHFQWSFFRDRHCPRQIFPRHQLFVF